MLKFRLLLFLVITTIGIHLNSFAQGTGNNPYSRIGLGDFQYLNGNVRNLGMGNTGVGYKGHYFINTLNPALLPNLKNKYIDFDKMDKQYLEEMNDLKHKLDRIEHLLIENKWR